MKVQNLIFNRLGNNISILIEYPERNIQIWDHISFKLKGFSFEISSICIDENDSLKIVMEIISGKKDKKVEFFFTEKKLFIDQLGTFLPVEEGFKGNVQNSEILFKSGMNPDLRSLFSDDQLFIPQKDFFKTVAMLFVG